MNGRRRLEIDTQQPYKRRGRRRLRGDSACERTRVPQVHRQCGTDGRFRVSSWVRVDSASNVFGFGRLLKPLDVKTCAHVAGAFSSVLSQVAEVDVNT